MKTMLYFIQNLKASLHMLRITIHCNHKNLSFPVGQKKTCLDCAMERKYDWETQKFSGKWRRYA